MFHLLVNSAKVISISSDTSLCKEMTKENKCYKNFGDHDSVNLVCLDHTSSNLSTILPYCGIISEEPITNHTSEICPQVAYSSIPYYQCYNTVDISNDGYVIVEF